MPCPAGTVKWAGCCGVALLWPRIGNGRKRKIPKQTQSGLYTQNTAQYRKPIKPVQHAINKNRQICICGALAMAAGAGAGEKNVAAEQQLSVPISLSSPPW